MKKIKVFQNNVILSGQLYMYISMQCTTGMVTWQSSLHMRYSPSHSQTLARFIWQVRSLSCCSVLSRMGNQSHLQRTTAQSWMMLSSFTAYTCLQLCSSASRKD